MQLSKEISFYQPTLHFFGKKSISFSFDLYTYTFFLNISLWELSELLLQFLLFEKPTLQKATPQRKKRNCILIYWKWQLWYINPPLPKKMYWPFIMTLPPPVSFWKKPYYYYSLTHKNLKYWLAWTHHLNEGYVGLIKMGLAVPEGVSQGEGSKPLTWSHLMNPTAP